MILDFEPGDKVINPANKDWGIGQIQSIIKEKPVDTTVVVAMSGGVDSSTVAGIMKKEE